MLRDLRFAARARDQLSSIRAWLAANAGAEVADETIYGLVDRCDILRENAHIGTPRDDIRDGLRTLSFRRRYTIGYLVEDRTVIIIGIIGRGQELRNLVGIGDR